ncbi:dienelactone hydrolase family protein [Candidatus Nitrosotalea bavarica]|uniref:dienelactone hydrolase family protein n=1 Tax=Candidatus Nitrosotalea bavarica TaxID=1903277 RepID=UPI000C6FD296|nr:alpha/beta family hydrolase [Candidatus Nitrosotalea bavarica]
MVLLTKNEKDSTFVEIQLDLVKLEGNLSIPKNSIGIVLFAHGSGSSRTSPRNRFVARELNQKGIAALLFDLLTREEEEVDMQTAHLRFDISLLSQRLVETTDWLLKNSKISNLNVGYFGASTGAAAALVAAAERPDIVKAVVSRGGRPDLAGPHLSSVKCPTLLLVGGYDDVVIELNKQAMDKLKSEKKLIIIQEATHLFEEPGKLEQVAKHATDWFMRYIGESN